MGGISFSKEKLASTSSSFKEEKEKVVTTIEKIRDSLLAIDEQWTGPEHDSASKDKEGALENMTKATDIVTNMEGALNQLSANADKVSYNS